MQIKDIATSDKLNMFSGINGIRPIERPSFEKPDAPKTQQLSFGEFLAKQYQAANNSGIEAEKAIQKAIAGEANNPHATVIAVQKASVSLTLMMSIKERLERAYQEITRMQIG